MKTLNIVSHEDIETHDVSISDILLVFTFISPVTYYIYNYLI